MKRRFCRAFISTEDLVGFEGDGWEVTQILSFFIIVERLPCKKLTNIAAKMTFLVNDIIRDPSKEMSQFLEFHRHIRPLHTFRSRWQKIKSTIEKGVHYGPGGENWPKMKKRRLDISSLSHTSSLGHSRSHYETLCRYGCVESSAGLTEEGARAVFLDQALLDLEYIGLELP